MQPEPPDLDHGLVVDELVVVEVHDDGRSPELIAIEDLPSVLVAFLQVGQDLEEREVRVQHTRLRAPHHVRPDEIEREPRLLEPIGNIPPAEAEARYYAAQEVTALAA